MKKATILYILRIRDGKTQVLMAKKTRVVGVGKWFGYGGKIEENETATECTARELRDESTLKINEEDLLPVGLIDFYKGDCPFGDPSFRVMFYIAWNFSGTEQESDEMKTPTWFDIDSLPLDEMKAGDEKFIPRILRGEIIKGFSRFSEDETILIESNIETCSISDLVI